MSKGAKAGLAVAVVAVLAAGLVWLVLGGSKKPVEVAPVEEAVVEEAAPAVEEEVAAAEEPAIDVPDIADALPEPGAMRPLVVAASAPADMAHECRQLLDEMRTRLGWDKIETVKCKLEMDMPHGILVAGEATFEQPNKANRLFELQKEGQSVLTMYFVTDGVFSEKGTVSVDGTRNPSESYEKDTVDGTSFWSGQVFDAGAHPYKELSTVKADPALAIFQKKDGSPIDAEEVKRLTAEEEGRAVELYIDPATLKWVAMRVYEQGVLTLEVSSVTYAELGEGITYPVGFDYVMPEAPRNGEAAPAKIAVRVSNVEVNPEVAANSFEVRGIMEK